jgi:hypothetical protein
MGAGSCESNLPETIQVDNRKRQLGADHGATKRSYPDA